jgi:signal transduction histidine kinase
MRPCRHHLKVTFVTVGVTPMATARPNFLKTLLTDMDPRRSLVAAIIWLVIGLAASFAVAASLWVGGVARDIVVQQHIRRLTLETDQLSSDLGQAITARVEALRASGSAGTLPQMFRRLLMAYPDLGWIAAADTNGILVATDGSVNANGTVGDQPWYLGGLQRPWLGVIEEARRSDHAPLLGNISAPIHDADGHVVGVVAARLNWRWGLSDIERLSDFLDPRGSAQTLVLDADGVVLVGPPQLRGRRWNGFVPGRPGTPRFERLPDGRIALIARAAVNNAGVPAQPSWQVQLSEPKEHVYQRANALALRILWISIGLGAATALLGALGARHLTNRLKRLTLSVAAVGRNDVERIALPLGRDEVAQLAAAFAKILDDLRRERSELLTLSSELERRVAVRTREVERLAEESRYAAIVRERLKIARDLHDTLAHSMMAMLSEVRLLRKLQVHDPASMPDELGRAEQVAQDGLNEARSAITQMRGNAVRDTGLGAALGKAFERFIDHTGLTGKLVTEPEAARFGDERAETLFRITEEALRNIERHAMATCVAVTLRTIGGTDVELRIEDNGVGFDPSLERPGHYGLVGLREQAQLIGAALRIESSPQRGTALIVNLRMTPEIL